MALSHLPLGTAFLQLTIASLAAILAAVVLWIRHLQARGIAIERRTALAAGTVAVALGPVYSNAIFGQVNGFVLLCTVIFVTLGPRWPSIGGAGLAIGAWLKIYPVLMIVIGLWNRSAWRRIAYAIGSAVVLVVIAAGLIPLGAYQTYLGEVLPQRLDKTAVHIINQSLVAFLERFTVPPERFLNWTGDQVVAVSGSVRAVNFAAGIAMIALLWRRAGRGPRVEAVDAAAAVMALAAVIAPLGWHHAYVLVLPLVILHLVSLRHAPPLHAAAVCACVAAMMVPAGRRFAVVELLAPWVQNVFYSRYLLATLVLMALTPAVPPHTEARS